ncbi:MAG: hypothetical protein ACUVSM_03070 [Armatimonadota bacterium]|jgi:hypothetical protein
MRLTSAIVLALLLWASVASAQYTGPWTYQWDFNASREGWSVTAPGYWTDPGWVPAAGPTLPDGAASGGGNGNFYLPDGSVARLNVSSLNIGSGTVGGNPKNPFVFQADVYIPNLLPLTGFDWGYPGNMIHTAGIALWGYSDGYDPITQSKAIWLFGDIKKGGLWTRDSNWDNVDHYTWWALEHQHGVPESSWWDRWITLQLDYGVTTPGKWSAWAYRPFPSPGISAGWVLVGNGSWDVHPTGVWFHTLQLGGPNSWTQAQFDNVKLYVQSVAAPIPEPVFFQMGALMGMGALGMLKIRRKA